MNRRLRSTALLLVLTSLAGPSQSAEPEFKVGVVMASRAYERDTATVSVGGIRTGAAKSWVSRVTVGVDGMRITGEWQPKTTISATAQDFPRGSDVSVAVTRSRMLLKHPDGSIVEARIVKREEAPDPKDRERD
jgi:hypothetical protein